MSEQVTHEMETVETAVNGSLAGRMKRRGRELANQRMEVFPVPGWEDLLAVELRVLSYEESRRIGTRLQRIRDEPLRELYAYADQIIAATEGFYEVDGDRRTPVEHTWQTLARAGAAQTLPEDLTPRKALIALVGDRRVAYLFGDFEEWMRGERRDIEEEVMRDFETTE